MSRALKIRRIGNSLGLILSEQIKRMGLGEGDMLYAVRTKDGIRDDGSQSVAVTGRGRLP